MADAEKPLWFRQLLGLKPYIDEGDWASLQAKAPAVIKSLHAEAPTVKKPMEVIFMDILQNKGPSTSEQVKAQYVKALTRATVELNTSTFDRIVKEEALSEQLDRIYSNIHKSWRKVWNYWRGDAAADYLKWAAIKVEIEDTPLTRVGRLRLLARHAAIGDRILPSFMEMIVQLWPIAALWLLKKGGTMLVTQTVSKSLEARKTKKKLQDLSSKLKSSKLSVKGASLLRKKSDGS